MELKVSVKVRPHGRTVSVGQNCYQIQWKAERLADDVKSEHQKLYRTLPVFVVSELRTLSGGTEVCMEVRHCQAHDEQSYEYLFSR